MSHGEQRANNLASIGEEFERFLKSLPKMKSGHKNSKLSQIKADGLKEICLKYGVQFEKVCKIFITN